MPKYAKNNSNHNKELPSPSQPKPIASSLKPKDFNKFQHPLYKYSAQNARVQ